MSVSVGSSGFVVESLPKRSVPYRMYSRAISPTTLSRPEPDSRGTTAWAAIWSPGRCYMFQCDFGYMISTQMFERFVMPDLSTCFEHMDHAFYHLDGKADERLVSFLEDEGILDHQLLESSERPHSVSELQSLSATSGKTG